MEHAVLEWLLPRVSTWGYVLLFLLAYFESAAFIGFLLPGETAVLLAGALAANGLLALDHVILITIIAAVTGDSTGYVIGRRFGPRLFARGRFILNRRRLHATEDFFRRHGGKTVLFGRFVSWLRPLAPFVAGTSRMRYPKFLFFNVYGGVLWSVTFSLLGYLVGSQWQAVKAGAARFGMGGLIVGAGLLAIYLLYRRRQHEWQETGRRADRLLMQRLSTPWRFVKARLRTDAWHGRTLTLAVLATAVCASALIAIEADAAGPGRLEQAGMALQAWSRTQLAPAALTRLSHAADLGARILDAGLVLALLSYWVTSRSWREAGVLAVFALAGAASLPAIDGLGARSLPTLAATCCALLLWGWTLHVLARIAHGEVVRTTAFTLGPLCVLGAGIGPVLQAHLGAALAGYCAGGIALAASFLLARALSERQPLR